MEPYLELVDVRRSFGEVTALAGLSLAVARGEFVTVLGPSGSGKTTTLNLIAGFDVPSAGEIRLGGRAITHEPSYARGIGMVFQNYALFPHMTVAENVGFPLRMRRCPPAQLAAQVGRALALVRMDGLDERYPAQLSGGQAQRVAIARAIVYEPDLLLMDEPLGALDRKLRAEMQFEIKRLHHELGTTVLYVTHDQEEALTMSDRIAVLHRGELEQCAAPRDIYDRPASPFVAGFIGETNFIPAAAASWQGRLVARAAGLELQVLYEPAAGAYAGQPLTIAIRPEHVRVVAQAAQPETSLHFRIGESVFVGDAVKCQLRSGELSLIAKVGVPDDPALLARGALVGATIDAARCRVFAT